MSFVLFGSDARYWVPIPIVLIANSIIFKKFVNRIHVPQSIINFPLFKFLQKIAKRTDKLEIEVIQKQVKITQPTLWRMRPLWDKDVKVVFCRDLDAIPIRREIVAMRLFLRCKNLYIHGVRSFREHNTPLLAGMCGFRAHKLRERQFIPKTFQDYVRFAKKNNVEYRSWIWGCDQEVLKIYFYRKHRKAEYMMRKTLDSPLGDAPEKLYWYSPTKLPQELYQRIDISDIDPRILEVGREVHKFAGSPVLGRTFLNYMKTILDIKCHMSKIIRKIFNANLSIREYYFGI